MTNKGTKIATWGTTLGAIAIASVTFPEIADSAKAQQISMAAQADFEAAYELASEDSLRFLIEAQSVRIEKTRLDYLIETNKSVLSETKCMAEAIYYEARSEKRSGQLAVAEVIQNRMKSKHFPSTACEVVYEGSERTTGCQFSFTCDGSMDIAPRGKAWDRSLKMAEFVMSGAHSPITNYATHYHTMEVSPPWSQTMRMTRQIGSHVFYRFAPRNYKVSEPILLVAPPI